MAKSFHRKRTRPGSADLRALDRQWLTCKMPDCYEAVEVDGTIAAVTCSLCVQRMVGGVALPRRRQAALASNN